MHPNPNLCMYMVSIEWILEVVFQNKSQGNSIRLTCCSKILLPHPLKSRALVLAPWTWMGFGFSWEETSMSSVTKYRPTYKSLTKQRILLEGK